MNELKPCPFCGNSKLEKQIVLVPQETYYLCRIICPECNVIMTERYDAYDGINAKRKAEKHIIHWWNRRTKT